MKHKNFYEDYNEIMYDERDLIESFLAKQYDIRYGRQRDTWHFEPAVEVLFNNGTPVDITDIKLDDDNIVMFNVKENDRKCSWYDCTYFAFGELSKVLDALPDADDIVMKNAVNDLAEFSVNLRCDLILQESPFVTKINGKDVSIYDVQYEDGRVISYDKQGRIVNDEYESDFLVGLRDHINIEVLHRSNEYKELMELLSLEENMRFECQNYGDATFVIDGTDVTFDVSSVRRSDNGGLVIYGNDIDADVCDNIELTEKDIKHEYLVGIISEMKGSKYTDIMDTHNGHNAELVRKINAAWKSDKYHESFCDILFALGCRDKQEIQDMFDIVIDCYEMAMEHAYEIMEDVCDNRDLETILSFIRYEE